MATITRSRLFLTRFSTELQHARLCTYSIKRKLSIQAQPVVDDSNQSTQGLSNPLKCPDFFLTRDLFTVKDLFDAKVHLGHRDELLHKNMQQFIYGSRLGHLIFDLDQTAELLQQALNFAAHIAFRGGIILFIAKLPQCCLMIEKTANACGEYSHTRRWNPITFSDYYNFYGSVTRLPDLCIFLNTFDSVIEQHPAVVSAAKLNIPTIGIVDSNADPNLITYPVPGNDDSESAISLYCQLFQEAILRGKTAKTQMTLSAKKIEKQEQLKKPMKEIVLEKIENM